MTQSYNLSQLANNLNTAGQLDATDGLSGAVPPANGGTGQSTYTVGDILYASGATALAKLSDVATGNALISGGVGAAPSWGKVGMATHVSGTLPVANGGTGLATLTANNVLLGNGTGNLQAVAPGTSGFVLTSNGSTWVSAAVTVGSSATSFTASGTFTIPSGITKLKMTIVGGGGNGATAGSGNAGGDGGGGGGAAIKYLSGLTPGNTLTVVVGGAAGTSSVASGTQTITTVSATGNRGIGSNGDLNIRGNAGVRGSTGTSGVNVRGGAGGSSIMGGGGLGGSGGTGGAGGTYGGGGGGGAYSTGCCSGPLAGGAGASGLVLFEY